MMKNCERAKIKSGGFVVTRKRAEKKLKWEKKFECLYQHR